MTLRARSIPMTKSLLSNKHSYRANESYLFRRSYFERHCWQIVSGQHVAISLPHAKRRRSGPRFTAPSKRFIVRLCMCTHTYNMATKTISITEKTHETLLREKKNKESFTDTILRITKKSGKLADCFGAWKMTDEEEEKISLVRISNQAK